MTPAQIRTIRASFARIEPALPILGYRFYEKLFVAAPKLRPIIGSDLHAQQRRLTKAITGLAQHRSAMALPALGGELERQSSASGRSGAAALSPDYLTVMRVTFLELLRAELDADFTDEVEDAWRAAFEVLSRSMLEDVDAPGLPTASDSFFARLSRRHLANRGADSAAAQGAEPHRFFS